MMQVEQIKAELKRRIERCTEIHSDINIIDAYRSMLGFIDTLNSKDSIIQDLDKASDEFADSHGFRIPYDGSNHYYDDVDVKASKDGFIAGAQWQKQQDTKLATINIDFANEQFKKGCDAGVKLCKENIKNSCPAGKVSTELNNAILIHLEKGNVEPGSKVIIITENEL